MATGGMDRRALLKRAAAAGAVAWTAPIVLESIASPAGALTLTGCFRFSILATDTLCENAAISGVIDSCVPPTPSVATCPTITDVTTGNINTYCLKQISDAETPNAPVGDCHPSGIEADDTVKFAIDTTLGACGCDGATIVAAGAKFRTLIIGTLTCYSTATTAIVITGGGTGVTFTNVGVGDWRNYTFIIKCT